jgi:AcrR family transcriptional regulator
MPKGFSEREKEIIRERLLENGLKTFSAYGLRKTNVEDLTRAIGISKGAFYLFYDSKEALFMDVMEAVERRFHETILAEIERPGPSPRARLRQVFVTAFSLWKQMPVLQMMTQGEYALLLGKMPPEKVAEHLQSDSEFVHTLVTRCNAAGIPITASEAQIDGLTKALFFISLHESDFGPNRFPGVLDLLVDLVAAFCVGETAMAPDMTGWTAPETKQEGLP